MRYARLSSALALILGAACADNTTAPPPSFPGATSHAISDATHGIAGNPHFFWLPPVTGQPPSEMLGTFERLASPQVAVVCQSSTQLAVPAECDGETLLFSFDRSNGLEVFDDYFKVNLDLQEADLRVTTDPASDYTTYRIQVFTDAMNEIGGPFLLGFADIQLGENGRDAKNLSTGETIGLVDGRTLPVRFRIDAGAYEYAVGTGIASGGPVPEDQQLCQVNCSVTLVPTDQITEASLSDSEAGEMTAMQFQPGDVSTTSVLIIDERIIEGEDADCAEGISLDKKHCYRYRITPDEAFNNDVRFGICPYDVPLEISAGWRILKVDYDEDQNPILTRPDPADVSDFLPCTMPSGTSSMIAAAFRRVADWLVPPLLADAPRVWGAMARDLSDVFWGLDAELQPVGDIEFTVTLGTTVSPTVQVVKLLPDPPEPLAEAQVTFQVSEWSLSELALPEGGVLVSSETTGGRVTSMTVLTGDDGVASVDWTITGGADSVFVTSPGAVTDSLHPQLPLVFTAQGIAPPAISAVVPSTLTVPGTGTAYGTFVVDGSGFGDGEISTAAPLLLTGASTVNGDGTSISRDFEIGAGAAPGSYKLYVATPFGEDSVPIEMEAPGTGTGSVTGAVTCESAPVVGIMVTLLQVPPGPTTWGATTTGSGVYVFGLVTPGTYTVNAYVTGYMPASETVVVSAGATSEADLEVCTPVGDPPPAS